MLDKFSHLKYWLEAFRLRTLPLAAATVLVGAVPALQLHTLNLSLFCLILFTTFCLQILSNLANDYGDYTKGTDNQERLGPERTLQGGKINLRSMKYMISFFVGLSLVSGIVTLYVALGLTQLITSLVMLLLGGAAIWAAIKYTVGKGAFGYKGLGDVFVFIFFGLVGVVGTSFLLSHQLHLNDFILSFTPGLLAVGVLNVNNLRDFDNDKASGKETLIVRKGTKWGKRYHYTLVIMAFVCFELYVLLGAFHWYWHFVYALLPLFWFHCRSIAKYEGRALDSQLKVLSLSSFMLAITLVFLALIIP